MTTESDGENSSLEGQIRSYFLGRVALAAGGFVTIPLLSRALGMQNYGKFSLWLTLTNWLPLLLGGWLQQSILRYHQEYMSGTALSRGLDDKRQDCLEDRLQEENEQGVGADFQRSLQVGSASAYRSTVRNLVVILTAGATLISGLAILLLLPHRCGLLEGTCIALITGASLVNIALGARAQAELQASLVVAADFVRTVLPILLIAGMVWMHMPCQTGVALCAFLVGLVGADLLLYWRVRRPQGNSGTCQGRRKPGSLVISLLVVRRLVGFGLPMGIWFGLITGQTLIGRLLLEHYGRSQHLAIFTGFQDFLAKTGTVLFMPVTYALHSRVMKLWAEARYAEAQEAIRRAYLYQGALALVLIGATVGLQSPLCQFLFGRAGTVHGSQESLSVAGLVFALVLSVVVANVGLVAHKGLELGERTRVMAYAMGLSTLLCLLCGRLLVVPFGAVGVAWSLVIANGFYLVASLLGSYRVLRVEPPVSLTRLPRTEVV